ncbi:MAG: flagellin [Planctomycetota bacterium]|nr:flagellin [Planctomycetota bacterium]
MLAIKNNIMSDNTQRMVAVNYDALAKSVQRLSSGLRINSAADDAAGLAVRELIRSDITVLNQGARNAQDAISMVQTAESALQVVDNLLVRMKELAEQAATDSYSPTQRSMMNAEFKEMAAEMDRIASSTNFNGTTLLNSASGQLTIHVGTGNGENDKILVKLVDASTEGLKVDDLNISNVGSAAAALTALDSAISSKDSARAAFGSKINRLESTISILNVQAETLSAAESRISDVDVAKEMSSLTRNQVMAQAGIAMLAQANSMPQLALKLLNG